MTTCDHVYLDIFIALFVGGMYYQIDMTVEMGVYNRCASLFFIMSILIFTPPFTAITTFALERDLLKKVRVCRQLCCWFFFFFFFQLLDDPYYCIAPLKLVICHISRFAWIRSIFVIVRETGAERLVVSPLGMASREDCLNLSHWRYTLCSVLSYHLFHDRLPVERWEVLRLLWNFAAVSTHRREHRAPNLHLHGKRHLCSRVAVFYSHHCFIPLRVLNKLDAYLLWMDHGFKRDALRALGPLDQRIRRANVHCCRWLHCKWDRCITW